MSEQWIGLHNPVRHAEFAADALVFCYPAYGGCDDWCSPVRPCRCCLAAEVEAQTARADAAEAKVRRVRGVATTRMAVVDHPDISVGWDEAMACVHRALGGAE